MLFIKLRNHFFAVIKKACYRLIYGKKVCFKKSVTWRKGFSLVVDGNGEVAIGENVFFNNYCSINCIERVSIGHDTIFGENVKIYDHNHRFRDSSTPIKKQGYKAEAISIGNDCWIGSNVVILKGACIGNHCVIGAGCVISGKVEDGTIVKNSSVLEMVKWLED